MYLFFIYLYLLLLTKVVVFAIPKFEASKPTAINENIKSSSSATTTSSSSSNSNYRRRLEHATDVQSSVALGYLMEMVYDISEHIEDLPADTDNPFTNDESSIDYFVDPPADTTVHYSPTALGVFIRAHRTLSNGVRQYGDIYYRILNTPIDGDFSAYRKPRLIDRDHSDINTAGMLTFNSPYVHMQSTTKNDQVNKTIVFNAVFGYNPLHFQTCEPSNGKPAVPDNCVHKDLGIVLTAASLTAANNQLQELGSPYSSMTLFASMSVDEGTPACGNTQYHKYIIEGGQGGRPNSYAYFVPGVESKGNFLRVALEVQAAARAQSTGSQELANFYSGDGVGTYYEYPHPDEEMKKKPAKAKLAQVVNIDLPNEVYVELDGFEGGFSIVAGGSNHYGILIPYHNGKIFHGYVVRINLKMIGDIYIDETDVLNPVIDRSEKYDCLSKIRFENWNSVTKSVETYDLGASPYGNNRGHTPIDQACIAILNLTSLDERAVGFRRGFKSKTFGFLSPALGDVAVRLDFRNNGDDFTLSQTKIAPLADLDRAYSGYSGGFADSKLDGSDVWACFTPMRTVYGPVGGAKSTNPADRFLLKPYHNAILACIGPNGWDHWDSHNDNWYTGKDITTFYNDVESVDLGVLMPQLRGFSDSVRISRYAVLAPLASDVHVYSGQVVRMYLGDGKNELVGDAIRIARNSNQGVRSLFQVMDMSKKDERLKGYSGIFSSGKYAILVPYRNAYEPENGQRGHGMLTRLDMNDFDKSGIDFADLTTTLRSQIPSIADPDLRGFCCGFASGKYAVLVPFFNADFNGKIARIQVTLDEFADLQEMDLAQVRNTSDPLLLSRQFTSGSLNYRGYRGGFVSLWPGTFD